jgi:hypothetical protein
LTLKTFAKLALASVEKKESSSKTVQKTKYEKCIKNFDDIIFEKKIIARPQHLHNLRKNTSQRRFSQTLTNIQRATIKRQLRDDLKIDYILVNIPHISATVFFIGKKIFFFVARASTQMCCELKNFSLCFFLYIFSVAVRRRQNNVDHTRSFYK